MPFWVVFVLLAVNVAVSVGVGRWAERTIEEHDVPFNDVTDRIVRRPGGARGAPGPPTGLSMARTILERHGAAQVDVTAGDVDCYIADFSWIQLADGRLDRASTSAATIAAHEAAHAIQDVSGWRPFKISRFTRDLALFASIFFVPAAAAGALAGQPAFTWVGFALFGYTLLAGLFTVWIEIDASRRALKELRSLAPHEVDLVGAKRLLVACGATYAWRPSSTWAISAVVPEAMIPTLAGQAAATASSCPAREAVAKAGAAVVAVAVAGSDLQRPAAVGGPTKRTPS